MKNKEVRNAEEGVPGSSEQTSKHKIRQIIEDIINEACEKSNRQLAALRFEVKDLSDRIVAKDKEILALREEIASLKNAYEQTESALRVLTAKSLVRKEKANRTEKAYRKFFSSDNGLLYRLGHILSAFSQLSQKDNPNANDMLKAFSPFINLANNLMVLDAELTGIATETVTLPEIPVEELVLRLNSEDEECFYTTLWQECEAPLRRLCDQNRDEAFEESGAYDALMADIKELLGNLRSCDIAVVPEPGSGFDKYFDNSGNEITPSRPLVMRKSNSYVYTRGLYNSLKPYTPWE